MRKILIYTHDIIPGRERLMPWRTLFEVAFFSKRNGFTSIILNGRPDFQRSKKKRREWNGIEIVDVAKPSKLLVNQINLFEGDVIFWPIAWHSSKKNLSILSDLNLPVVCYFPGGCYSKIQTLQSIFYIGIRPSLPYIADAFIPPSILVNTLKRQRVRACIGMTPLTIKRIIAKGWPIDKSFIILPGKDNLKFLKPDYSIINKYRPLCYNKKIFTFFGSPSPIRGGIMLLEIFDKLVSIDKDVLLLCLMRSDPGISSVRFIKTLNLLKNKNRVIVIWDKLSTNQLIGCLNKSYGVILPFLLIPSEIPLSFLEVLSLGIPIITTTNGGTTDYIGDAAYIAKPGSKKSLLKQLICALQNTELRKRKIELAKKIMSKHPTWEEVGEQWIKLA